jgi:hypothetical protein
MGMSSNFREGMRRLGIVVSVSLGVAAGIRGYFLAADTYALAANGFRQESVLLNYAVASLLPVLGFWLPFEVSRFLVWISSALSGQPTAPERPRQVVPRKRPGTARRVGSSHEARRPTASPSNAGALNMANQPRKK